MTVTLVRALSLLVCISAMGATQGRAEDVFSLEGRLLVADPRSPDPNFEHAVVLVIKHNERGAFGVVINQPLRKLPLGLLQRLLGQEPVEGSKEVTLYKGGPVDLDAITILHSNDYRSRDTVPITKDISITGSAKVIEDMALGRGPERVMLSMGYVGWDTGLLESELALGLWGSIPLDPDLIFAEDKAKVWAEARRRRGVAL